jgi:hypothetical protein
MAAVTGLRNQSNEPSRPWTSRDLGWWGLLPPIRFGDSRWWLPLSDVAMVGLSRALFDAPSGVATPAPHAVRQLAATMLDDPPLLLFAVLRSSGESFVAVSELAEQLAGSLLDELSSGDWMLAAPEMTPQHQRHWSRLMAQCRASDPNAWIERAASWLRVMGPAVDPEWIASLPKVIADQTADGDRSMAGSELLQRIARAKSRERATETSLVALAEKQKLAAAKQLAYGLSHEINNPLANISARAQQLARDESNPTRRQSLEQIVAQVYRAHEMIAGLMFFANPPEPTPESVDVNELIGEVVDEFAAVAADADIRLLRNGSETPAVVRVDRLMMLEAIRVLVRNSIEAIGQGGTVVVSLEQQTEPQGSRRWLVHVADSGPGLSVEASRHAFDPFYSGREAGRGLGLGLCRAYRVAQLHDATVRISGGLAGCVATLAIPG